MNAAPILLLLAACSGSEMLAVEAEGSIVLRDGTVVDPEDASTLAPGTIVIASDGVGSVRRVISVDGGVATEPASLFDAFAQASYRYTLAIDPEDVEPTVKIPDIDVRTTLGLAPEIELAFTIADDGLVSFDAIASGAFEARIDAATALPGGGWNGVKTIESRPVHVVTTVDGVPVVLGARVVTDLAVYAGGNATLAADVTANVAFSTGVHFTRATGWTASDASRPTVRVREMHASGDGHATVVATMRLELSLFGEVMPYTQLRAVGSVEAGSCPKGTFELLEAGVGAGVGLERSTLLPGSELRYVSVFENAAPVVTDATCR